MPATTRSWLREGLRGCLEQVMNLDRYDLDRHDLDRHDLDRHDLHRSMLPELGAKAVPCGRFRFTLETYRKGARSSPPPAP